MGLIHSCLGKKSNKVGVLSEEEEEAYGKIEEETKKEMEDDIIHTTPLPWLMFCTEPSITKAANTDEGDSSTVTEVVQKKRRRVLQYRIQVLSAQTATHQFDKKTKASRRRGL